MSDWNEHRDEARYEAMVDEPPRNFAEEKENELRQAMTRGTHVRRGTSASLWEQRIQAGECPRGSCSGSLDTEGYCSLCGFSLTEHRANVRVAAREQPADWLPVLPQALFLDEYAPADTEEAA